MPSHDRRPVHEGKDVQRVADMTVRDRRMGNNELPDTLTISIDWTRSRERRAAVGKDHQRGDSRVDPLEEGLGVYFGKCIRELISNARLDALRASP